MKILLVDDDEDIVTMLQFRIEKLGYEIEAVGSGEEALAKVRTSPPSLIIMDLNIPAPNGAEVAETLKKEGFSTPIILLTGSVDAKIDSRAVNELVIKPYDWAELQKHIEKYAPSTKK